MSALIIDVPAAITRVACGRILSAIRARIRAVRKGGEGCVCVRAWRYTRGEEWVHPVSPHLIKLARYITNIRLQTNQFSPPSAVNFTRDETRADCHTTSNRWKSSDIWKLFVKRKKKKRNLRNFSSIYLFISFSISRYRKYFRCYFDRPISRNETWD